ncbi:MAG: hypothetical protein JWP62_1479 [Blastococcus sp.]|jgi:uncharacterized membrane protein|nr:hypothetical protein [Blastococcus sp.]
MDSREQKDPQSSLLPSDLPVTRLPPAAWGLWQVAASGAVGTAAAVVIALATPVDATYGVLLGWDVGTLVYLLWVWQLNRGLDSEGTAEAAVREDPTRPVTDVILLVAAVASLAAVIYAVADAGHSSGAAQALKLTLGISSIANSWFLVHTLFAMRYAREYYVDEDGGIDFNTADPPVWTDFAYLSFTIGMTFQVSDTDLQTSELRRLALRQMLISYLFGAVIIAIAINLVAGLGK